MFLSDQTVLTAYFLGFPILLIPEHFHIIVSCLSFWFDAVPGPTSFRSLGLHIFLTPSELC